MQEGLNTYDNRGNRLISPFKTNVCLMLTYHIECVLYKITGELKTYINIFKGGERENAFLVGFFFFGNSVFLIGYFIYLHFQCYPLSWFPLHKPHIPSSSPLPLSGCSSTCPPTSASAAQHSHILGHQASTGPMGSSSKDTLQDYLRLHISWSHGYPLCTLWLVV